MNNIRFKAWDNDKKKMAKVKAIDWDCNDKIVTCHLEYADSSVEKKYPEKDYGDDIVFLHCSGIFDGSGLEVYEGAILHMDSHWGVRIDYERGSLWVRDADKIRHANKILNVPISQFDFENWVIIGNIYENPELLN